MLMVFEQESAGPAEAQPATLWTSTISKQLPLLRTCQGQGDFTPGVESWNRVEGRHRSHVHGRRWNANGFPSSLRRDDEGIRCQRGTLPSARIKGTQIESTRIQRGVYWSSESDPTERSTSNTKQSLTSQQNSSMKNVAAWRQQTPAEASSEHTKQSKVRSRATNDFTERQIGATMGLDSSVLKWLARRAAWTLTTFHLGGASKSRRSVSGYSSNHTGLRDHSRRSL